ncbi:hypothetical protein DAEQUDRAFT_811159 [Daedalea quercina L-15889]|uniref:Uncharacterized protein n=1 Tax=Daedalea quercina L-15889 TaxID=1314783 RepID=A0A165QSX5_9APHY|nr:hypothetical protein DAEQUDRAFT_811159 [Daedalea quercina L-15889]
MYFVCAAVQARGQGGRACDSPASLHYIPSFPIYPPRTLFPGHPHPLRPARLSPGPIPAESPPVRAPPPLPLRRPTAHGEQAFLSLCVRARRQRRASACVRGTGDGLDRGRAHSTPSRGIQAHPSLAESPAPPPPRPPPRSRGRLAASGRPVVGAARQRGAGREAAGARAPAAGEGLSRRRPRHRHGRPQLCLGPAHGLSSQGPGPAHRGGGCPPIAPASAPASGVGERGADGTIAGACAWDGACLTALVLLLNRSAPVLSPHCLPLPIPPSLPTPTSHAARPGRRRPPPALVPPRAAGGGGGAGCGAREVVGPVEAPRKHSRLLATTAPVGAGAATPLRS